MMQLDMRPTLQKVIQGFQALKNQWEPRIPISFEKGNYLVKTVTEAWEMREVLKLRYLVFHREYKKAKLPFGWDLDEFDFLADHLVIIEKGKPGRNGKETRGKVVGTYRMICSQFSDKFYSQGEFDLSRFLAIPGTKLELGRACIRPEYRKGSVMNLLWRGVSEYLKQTKADYLFGCSSVKEFEVEKVAQLVYHFEKKGHVSDDYRIRPVPAFTLTGLSERLEELRTADRQAASVAATDGSALTDGAEKTAFDVSGYLPPLLEMYLLAGAKVLGEPAYDKDFYCMDFLTILDTAKMSEFFQRRYGKDGNA